MGGNRPTDEDDLRVGASSAAPRPPDALSPASRDATIAVLARSHGIDPESARALLAPYLALIEQLERDNARIRSANVAESLRAFHAAIGQADNPIPSWPDDETLTLRMGLIREEFEEVMAALGDREPLADVAKELCDLVYVTVHAAVSMGIPFEECWRRVHESNLAKASGRGRTTGKITKPVGWEPPDLSGVINAAQAVGDEPTQKGSGPPED